MKSILRGGSLNIPLMYSSSWDRNLFIFMKNFLFWHYLQHYSGATRTIETKLCLWVHQQVCCELLSKVISINRKSCFYQLATASPLPLLKVQVSNKMFCWFFIALPFLLKCKSPIKFPANSSSPCDSNLPCNSSSIHSGQCPGLALEKTEREKISLFCTFCTVALD